MATNFFLEVTTLKLGRDSVSHRKEEKSNTEVFSVSGLNDIVNILEGLEQGNNGKVRFMRAILVKR